MTMDDTELSEWLADDALPVTDANKQAITAIFAHNAGGYLADHEVRAVLLAGDNFDGVVAAILALDGPDITADAGENPPTRSIREQPELAELVGKPDLRSVTE